MRGWAGPLVIFGELGALALALVAVLALANMLLWLMSQFWVWLLLGGTLVTGAWAYGRYRVTWSDANGAHTTWRWELPQPHVQEGIGFQLVPMTVQPSYCDQCGTLLVNGGCPFCNAGR